MGSVEIGKGKQQYMPFNFCSVLIPSYRPENAKCDSLAGIWGFGKLLLITAVVLCSLTGGFQELKIIQA